MKKLLTASAIIYSFFGFAQVGIGTSTPRDQLDVAGNILLESYIILQNTNAATGNYHLLVRSTDSNPVGEVKKLDIDLRSVGPINKYKVRITNPNKLNVLELNTNLDVSKYHIGVTEAVFSGPAIKSTSTSNNNPVYGTYFTSVQRVGGKYKISLNFNNAGTQNNQNGIWDLSLIVFEKPLVKDWGTFTGSVTSANGYRGVSNNTPIGLQ